MTSLLLSLALVQLLAPMERDWTRATYSATPICAAGHADCRGTATLAITTIDGPLEIARLAARAGERFEIAMPADGPIHPCELELEVALDGHAAAVVGGLSCLPMPVDLGAWRIPVEARARPRPSEPAPAAESAMTIELTGGDPGETLCLGWPGIWECGDTTWYTLSSRHVRRIGPRAWAITDSQAVPDAGFATTRGRTLLVDSWRMSRERGAVRFELPGHEPRRSVRGRVLDGSGAPIAGATVNAGASRASSARDGSFELAPLLPRDWTLRVEDARWSAEALEIDLRDGDRGDLVLVARPQRTVRIDARELERGLGDAAGVLLLVWGPAPHPAASLHLARERLREPFDVPALHGGELRLALVPIPAGGLDLPPSRAEWLREAWPSRRTVRFDGRTAEARFP